MAFHSLRLPDLPAWQAYQRYSSRVAEALEAAYRELFAGPDDKRTYLGALRRVEAVQNLPMCLPQRDRVNYVKSWVFRKLDEDELSLDAIDDTIDIAYTLGDLASLRDALHFRGPMLRRVILFGQAAEDLSLAVAIHRRIGELLGESDPLLELDLLTQLVTYEFLTAHYDAATRLSAEARSLAAHIPELTATRKGKLVSATLDLGDAHLYRWSGQSKLASAAAFNAAEIYAELEAPISAGRVRTMLCDCTLDQIERLPLGTERDTLIWQTRVDLRLAQSFAREGNDYIGKRMIELRRARYSRLTGGNEDRVAAIEGVANAAQSLGDEALLSEAFTYLGDELAARGEIESALNRYREALAVLDGSEALALETWPRRALHQWYEQHPTTLD